MISHNAQKIFKNTLYDLSYMINHVMYFGLNMVKNTSNFYSEKK